MSRIYAATYSNVPVYEYNIDGNHVMRRRADDWINATHILKVAEFDKPARTRILEREVQKNTHEKVQGGYGKYQGTWIPLGDGRMLAQRTGCLEKLLPIFDYEPGDHSPPPAPKHATASSNRTKAPRAPPAPKRVPVPKMPHQMSDVSYDNSSMVFDATPERDTVESDSDDEMIGNGQYGSRKRRRVNNEKPPQMSWQEQQQLQWNDELLDYFMLQKTDEPLPAPEPPPYVDLNKAVDNRGHTPMHWAAAMGDLNLVKSFERKGAAIDALNEHGNTPLMRAVFFTNNFDRQTMPQLIDILHSTVGLRDWFGGTVFHHIAMTTVSKSKYACARYYVDSMLQKLTEVYPPSQVCRLLDQQDHNGDTAILLAAKHGARKCVRAFLNAGASPDIPNHNGETAEVLIEALNARRRDRYRVGNSSSPIPGMNDQPLSQTAVPRSSAVAGDLPVAELSGLQPASAASRASNVFQSEAASLISSQLPTLIASRTEVLAAAIESELAEREAEAQDTDRLLEKRKEDLEIIRKQCTELAQKLEIAEDSTAMDVFVGGENGGGKSPTRAQHSSEVERLLSECEQAIEAEQDAELAKIVETSSRERDNNAASHHENKRALLERLSELRSSHRQQISELVNLQSTVAQANTEAPGAKYNNSNSTTMEHHGTDAVDAHDSIFERQDTSLYKRLITAALGVKVEDVESLLPEILSELEEGRAALQSGSAVLGAIAADREHGSAIDMPMDVTPLDGVGLDSSVQIDGVRG